MLSAGFALCDFCPYMLAIQSYCKTRIYGITNLNPQNVLPISYQRRAIVRHRYRKLRKYIHKNNFFSVSLRAIVRRKYRGPENLFVPILFPAFAKLALNVPGIRRFCGCDGGTAKQFQQPQKCGGEKIHKGACADWIFSQPEPP
jgi:hypothetical protein